MTNFQPELLNWQTGFLAGWTYQREVKTWYQGSFRTQHELTRPCPTCGSTIKCRVTRRALEGDAVNHGLALRRCERCRDALKGRSEESYESRKTATKEVTEPTPAVHTDNAKIAELEEQAKIHLRTMKDFNTELFKAYNRIEQLETYIVACGGAVPPEQETGEMMPWAK